MALDFNVSPYFVDFDSAKNFYDILFRPGYSVQARELSEVASILEEQIGRFGDHIFSEGAMVTPGQITLDQNFQYAILNPTYNGASVAFNLVDPTVVGSTVQVQ